MSSVTRRDFFKFASAAATVLAACELILPSRTIFLPPAGGWYSESFVEKLNRLVAEAMNRKYDEMMAAIAEVNDPVLFPSYARVFRPEKIIVASTRIELPS